MELPPSASVERGTQCSVVKQGPVTTSEEASTESVLKKMEENRIISEIAEALEGSSSEFPQQEPSSDFKQYKNTSLSACTSSFQWNVDTANINQLLGDEFDRLTECVNPNEVHFSFNCETEIGKEDREIIDTDVLQNSLNDEFLDSLMNEITNANLESNEAKTSLINTEEAFMDCTESLFSHSTLAADSDSGYESVESPNSICSQSTDTDSDHLIDEVLEMNASENFAFNDIFPSFLSSPLN